MMDGHWTLERDGCGVGIVFVGENAGAREAGNVVGYRFVEEQLAFLVESHEGCGGDGFGHRMDAVDAVALELAGAVGEDELATVHERGIDAGEGAFFDLRIDVVADAGEAVWRFGCEERREGEREDVTAKH